MKLPVLQTVLVLLAILAVLAGCTGSPQAPAAATPGQQNSFSGLLLDRSEIPFTVMDEKTTSPDLSKPELMIFHPTRGVVRVSSSEKTASPATFTFGQTIIEYPPGNAASAFTMFDELNRQADQSRFKITFLPDPGIGNQSSAIIIADRTGATNPMVLVAFEKSGYMESVFMTGPELDTPALLRSARAAAAKIG